MRARQHYMLIAAVMVAGSTGGAAGCLGTTPQEREPAVQGDYDDGDEEHRPGQPCLLCHGTGHLTKPPGGDVFVIAGTVYGTIDADEDDGLEDVAVVITDAQDREFTAMTNSAGNFMIDVDSGASAPRDKGKGKLGIPFTPTYPLSVVIRRDADEQVMRSHIWRDGSCAHCHGPTPGAASVGRVYLFDLELQ